MPYTKLYKTRVNYIATYAPKLYLLFIFRSKLIWLFGRVTYISLTKIPKNWFIGYWFCIHREKNIKTLFFLKGLRHWQSTEWPIQLAGRMQLPRKFNIITAKLGYPLLIETIIDTLRQAAQFWAFLLPTLKIA